MSNFCQEFFYIITFFRSGSDRKLNNTNNHYNQSFQGSSESYLLDFVSIIVLKPKLPDVDDEYYSTIKNMPRIVKPNGFIITDTICENLFQKVGVDKMLTKISAGIFKKSNN